MRLSSHSLGPFVREQEEDKDEELSDLLLTLHDVWTAITSLSLRRQAILWLRFAEELSRARIIALFRSRSGVAEPQVFRATGKFEESGKEQPCS